MMNKLNKEQYDKLTKYKVHLRRGICDYVYALYAKDFNELLSIYRELGGNERINYSCSTCQLKLTKTLGKLYFEFEAELNKNKIEKLSDEVVEAVLEEPIVEEEEPQPEEPQPEEKPKKRRRRKKEEKDDE